MNRPGRGIYSPADLYFFLFPKLVSAFATILVAPRCTVNLSTHRCPEGGGGLLEVSRLGQNYCLLPQMLTTY